MTTQEIQNTTALPKIEIRVTVIHGPVTFLYDSHSQKFHVLNLFINTKSIFDFHQSFIHIIMVFIQHCKIITGDPGQISHYKISP